MNNHQLENYYSRLIEVLDVTGVVTYTDLEYCKLLTEKEIKNNCVQPNVNGSLHLDNVSRVEVIDEKGRSYVNWDESNKVALLFQDKGKTIKVVIKK
jgi:hypothetical protein